MFYTLCTSYVWIQKSDTMKKNINFYSIFVFVYWNSKINSLQLKIIRGNFYTVKSAQMDKKNCNC